MKSFVAALRRLVLPFGATSGQRIVLDGVNGVIEVYDALGLKFLTMDGTSGFVVFDGSGNLLMSLNATTGLAVYDTNGFIRTQLAIPGGAYSFLELLSALSSETDGAFLIAQGLGTNPNQRVNMSMGSSDLGHGTMRWKITSRQNNTDPHIVRLDTSQLSGVTVQPILDLTGTEVGGTQPKTRVVADDYWIGADNGADVAPVMTRSIPRGELGATSKQTDTGPTSAGTELDIITAPVVNVGDGTRAIRLTLHIRGIAPTVLGDVFTIRLKEGATIFQEQNFRTATAATASDGMMMVVSLNAGFNKPSAGNHTYKATIQRVLGTGTGTVQGAATRPIQLLVDDVGNG